MQKRKIALLGSTGSIGKQTLSVIDDHPDHFDVVALATHSSFEIISQYDRYKPQIITVFNPAVAEQVKRERPQAKVLTGKEGLLALIDQPMDLLIAAMVGMDALPPVAKAIRNKIPIAIANKELLVAAGEWITHEAARYEIPLLPIDSEHNAIFQLLHNQNVKQIQNIYLTASGGPFRLYTADQLQKVTVDEALCHPTWRMGTKNTIDSSTLMNKGLEVIEAKWLFNLDPHQIKVVIHPQSEVHAMVEWTDHSFYLQASSPSMKSPINYCLHYPDRKPADIPALDFSQIHQWDFFPPDMNRFKCLRLAYDALKIGKSMSCFMNAVNEECVSLFLQKKMGWLQIADTIEHLMEKHQPNEMSSLEDILEQDILARNSLREYIH